MRPARPAGRRASATTVRVGDGHVDPRSSRPGHVHSVSTPPIERPERQEDHRHARVDPHRPAPFPRWANALMTSAAGGRDHQRRAKPLGSARAIDDPRLAVRASPHERGRGRRRSTTPARKTCTRLTMSATRRRRPPRERRDRQQVGVHDPLQTESATGRGRAGSTAARRSRPSGRARIIDREPVIAASTHQLRFASLSPPTGAVIEVGKGPHRRCDRPAPARPASRRWRSTSAR